MNRIYGHGRQFVWNCITVAIRIGYEFRTKKTAARFRFRLSRFCFRFSNLCAFISSHPQREQTKKMSGRSSICLTLKDLKISSLGKKHKVNPCKGLLDNFLESLEMQGERNVPKSLAKSLLDCVEAPVSSLCT